MANHRREQTYPQQQSQAPFQIRVGLSICTPSSLSPYKFYWAHLNFVYCCPWPGFFSLVLADESFHLSSLVAHTLGLFFSTNSFDNLQIFHHKWRYRVPDHIFHQYTSPRIIDTNLTNRAFFTLRTNNFIFASSAIWWSLLGERCYHSFVDLHDSRVVRARGEDRLVVSLYLLLHCIQLLEHDQMFWSFDLGTRASRREHQSHCLFQTK